MTPKGAARLGLLAAMVTLSCARAPSRLQVTALTDGEWAVIDRSERGAIVQRSAHTNLRAARVTATALPTFGLLTDRLSPLVIDTFSLHAGRSIIPMVRVGGGAFFTARHGQPHLRRSPADARLYAFEHEDAIWVFKTPDSMNKLTLDFDLDTLRTRQREGEVILYWSVDPVWSGDGKFIAFLSNREAVRTGGRGQSIWMIDAYTGVQRPLYEVTGSSAHTEAALGEEFVFTTTAAPGVFAIHPRSRQVRKLGDGYVLAAHPAGAALLLNQNGRLLLLRGEARDTLPPAPQGQVWSTHASISPSGAAVALFATDQAGRYTLHALRADGNEIPGYVLPGPPAYGPAWTSETSLIFSLREDGELRTYRAELR